MQQWLDPVKLFSATAATGSTVCFPVQDRQHVFLQFASSGSANYTMKFQISNSFAPVDFSVAASITNPRSYIQVKELITNTAIDGGVGITAAGADVMRNFEVNTNGQRRF